MDVKSVSKQLIGCLGGADNIRNAEACMTRLRVSVSDKIKVDMDAIKKVDGVMGVVDADTVQIVFGPGVVNKVLNAFRETLKELQAESSGAKDGKTSGGIIRDILRGVHIRNGLKHIANIFIPLLAGIIAAGLINGITNAINAASGGAWSGLWWYETIRTIGWAVFAYLPVFVGYNAAKEFGGTPILGGLAGAVCVFNNSMPLLSPVGENGIVLPLTNEIYDPANGGIIAAIIAGALFAVLEKKLRKIMPGIIDTFITPLIVTVVGMFALVLAIQPLSELLEKGLYFALNFFYSELGVFGGLILSMGFLPLVSVGLHQALTPINVMLNDPNGATGGINYLLPILMMAGGGQVGAGLALYIKTRNKGFRKILRGSIPVGMLGVAEPLMYGATLPLGRPFITACIGSGIGGVLASLFHLGAISQGVSGLFGVLIMQPGQGAWFLLSLLGACIGGFVATWFFGFDEKRINEVYGEDDEKSLEIGAPVQGTILPIQEVKDPVFADEVTGPGIAILPKDGTFLAPCDGTLEVLFPTGHAYGISGPGGAEILVHIGLDTVNLDGKYFTPIAKHGDTVKKGDRIVEVNLEGVKNAGYEIVTPVVISGMGDYTDVQKQKGDVSPEDPVMILK